MTLVHIMRGPNTCRKVLEKMRWCFGCRRYLVHSLVALFDSEPSYYEPVCVWDCPRCHRDRTDFPSSVY